MHISQASLDRDAASATLFTKVDTRTCPLNVYVNITGLVTKVQVKALHRCCLHLLTRDSATPA